MQKSDNRESLFLLVKYLDLSVKYLDLSVKYLDLSVKYQDLSVKYGVIPVKKFLAAKLKLFALRTSSNEKRPRRDAKVLKPCYEVVLFRKSAHV